MSYASTIDTIKSVDKMIGFSRYALLSAIKRAHRAFFARQASQINDPAYRAKIVEMAETAGRLQRTMDAAKLEAPSVHL